MELKLGDHAILHDSKAPFDSTFSLRAVRRDGLDTEVFKHSTHVSGVLFALQLFFHRPVAVSAHKRPVAVLIDR